jgi:glucose/arabinose dehydrogenase
LKRLQLLFALFAILFLKMVLPIDYFYDYGSSVTENAGSSDEPMINDPNLAIEVVARGINFPTSMAFVGVDDILVLEKNTGNFKRIVNDGTLQKDLIRVSIANESERGLLGIDISNGSDRDSYDKNRGINHDNKTFVFAYYTEPLKKDRNETKQERYNATQDENLRNRLYRYELDDGKLTNPTLLFDIPVGPGRFHQGGQVLIGPDNNIYVGIGDYNDPLLKTANNESGKEPDGRGGILRLTKNGHALKSGGVLGDSYPLNLYYAYGIRNTFGMDFDPVTGNLWDTENGPEFGDEINLVEPGFNSGSKIVQGVWTVIGHNFTRDPKGLVDFGGKGKYSSPEFTWNKTVGVTALKFLDSDKYGKEYKNDMFVGDFMRGNIYHFDLNKNRTGLSLSGQLKDTIAYEDKELQNVIFGRGFGGVTDMEVGPDGYLYILAINHHPNNDCDPSWPILRPDCISFSGKDVEGSIFRIVPKK